MKILLIDNYDSFTYNLVHYLEGCDCVVEVCRNNEIPVDRIEAFDKLVISPGPGLPAQAGRLMEMLDQWMDKKPILGVCLGFQAMVEKFGGQLFNQEKVKHGISEKAFKSGESKLFRNVPDSFRVGLYHSWAADPSHFPTDLTITLNSESEIIMAFEHCSLPVCGVQFHPESIMTEHGKAIVHNFLQNFN